MELDGTHASKHLVGMMGKLVRRCISRVLSTGPIPDHFAFILDGNRRYAKKWKLEEGEGHKYGFIALLSICRYLYEMGVKYITVYAFSIDNFRRKPQFVQYLMGMMMHRSELLLKQESILNVYGVKVHFAGNLKLLSEPVRVAAEKVMAATSQNSRAMLIVCVAYTSTDEIVHGVQESCKEKWKVGRDEEARPVIKVVDIERHMYMGAAPDPCVLVRTSGETRLSNFLLWQTSHSILYSPATLWPEIGFWDIVWAIILWQHHYSYLQKIKMSV